MGGVFISYRIEDADYGVAYLHEALTREFGADQVFLDAGPIGFGQNWRQEILTRLRSAAVALVVIGPNWLTAVGRVSSQRAIDDPQDWVRREIAEALASGIPVVPVLIDGTARPKFAELPADIASLSRHQTLRLHLRTSTTDIRRLTDSLVAMAPELAATQPGAAEAQEITAARGMLAERERQTVELLRAESNREGIAAALAELGDYEKAVVVYQEHVSHLEVTLGEDHPETLAQSVAMVSALHDNGQHQQALIHAESIFDRAARRLGPNHPTTLAATLVLGSSLRENGHVLRAMSVDMELHLHCDRLLGPLHPRTLQAAASVACDYANCGDPEEARDLNERTLDGYRRVLGEDHPDTLACAVNLAADYRDLGDPRAAELHADTLHRYRRTLGDDHPDTLLCAATSPAPTRALSTWLEHRLSRRPMGRWSELLLDSDDTRERRS